MLSLLCLNFTCAGCFNDILLQHAIFCIIILIVIVGVSLKVPIAFNFVQLSSHVLDHFFGREVLENHLHR